ncbi:hypothetical protein BDZ45DRAFT_738613 [Acephala macrosclerotiorum]|nr:hypothetical protein BDZ45DRAFT_738613 [Acephala macrosclerotiorum]
MYYESVLKELLRDQVLRGPSMKNEPAFFRRLEQSMDVVREKTPSWRSSRAGTTVYGNYDYLLEVERELAAFHGSETAWICYSGLLANMPRPSLGTLSISAKDMDIIPNAHLRTAFEAQHVRPVQAITEIAAPTDQATTMSGSIFSRDALQFSNLVTAEEHLFGLDENTRVTTHLRLVVPYSLTTLQYLPYWRDGNADEWRAILNYFSSPRDRKAAIQKGGKSVAAARAGTLALLGSNTKAVQALILLWNILLKPRSAMKPTAILQTVKNGGLLLIIALNSGFYRCCNFGTTEEFVSALKEYIAGPPIGAQICAFFAGEPCGHGNQMYRFY